MKPYFLVAFPNGCYPQKRIKIMTKARWSTEYQWYERRFLISQTTFDLFGLAKWTSDSPPRNQDVLPYGGKLPCLTVGWTIRFIREHTRIVNEAVGSTTTVLRSVKCPRCFLSWATNTAVFLWLMLPPIYFLSCTETMHACSVTIHTTDTNETFLIISIFKQNIH